MKPMGVGVIGCGDISRVYMEATSRFSNYFDIIACQDIVPEKARERADKFNIPKVYSSLEDLLQDSDVEIVLNLTVPKVHGEIAIQAIQAGKHVYNEKPLALTREEAATLLDSAAKNKLTVGCAPDTVLGAGYQTVRKLIDDDWIGKVVAGTAFMQCHGHETWHPNPEFFYKPGGGPLFDMGPYYLTALITLLGPVNRVSSCTGSAFAQRTITSKPKQGQIIDVETPTHIAGTLEFVSGAIITLVTSFDVWAHTLPCMELHGTRGSLQAPDPNTFGGPVKVLSSNTGAWSEIPLLFSYAEQSRGIGLADQVASIRANRTLRAGGDIAYHVLDVMFALLESSDTGTHVMIQSTVNRPEPMMAGLHDGDIGN